MSRGEQPLNLLLLIHVAECFLPLHKFMGAELVWKTETGLKRCQQLLRKLIIAVTYSKLLSCCCMCTVFCPNLPFAPQSQTPFEPSFHFAD
jgi:hypothetical protein